jgi:hypothetical protein
MRTKRPRSLSSGTVRAPEVEHRLVQPADQLVHDGLQRPAVGHLPSMPSGTIISSDGTSAWK